MIFMDLLLWWYGPGWVRMFQQILERPKKLGQAFSIGTLLKTLFSPWKRIVSGGGKGLDAKFRAMLDNLVSRTVGFVVRIMVLIAAGVSTLSSLLYGIGVALIWPLIPVLVVYCLLRGVTG